MFIVVCINTTHFTDDKNRIFLKPILGHSDYQHDYINASLIEVSFKSDNSIIIILLLPNVNNYSCLQDPSHKATFIATQGWFKNLIHSVMKRLVHYIHKLFLKMKYLADDNYYS